MLFTALLLGLFAAGCTFVVRKVVPQDWLLFKPFSCDLCMSWWSAWLGVILINVTEPMGFLHAVPIVFAGTGLSVLLVKMGNRLSDD
jgi:hypothetical protein